MKFLLMMFVVCAHAQVGLYWPTATSTPVPLALNFTDSINDSGVIVGRHAGVPAEVTTAAPTVLIPLAGLDATCSPVDINSSGQVVGYCNQNSQQQPFLWSSGGGIQILSRTGCYSAAAIAINDSGQMLVVGPASTCQGVFLWSSGSGWAAVGDTTIGSPLTQDAHGLNSSGAAACDESKNIPSAWTGHVGAYGRAAAVCGSSVTVLDLGSTINNEISHVVAINASGQTIGYGMSPTTVTGFFWDPSAGVTTIPGFMPLGSAKSLNDSGMAIGDIGSSGGGPGVWTNSGGVQALSVPVDAAYTAVTGVNSSGQIVGWYWPNH